MEQDKTVTALHSIKGGGAPDERKEALRRLRAALPQQIEYVQLMAKLHRAKFVALKAEGFTDAEALELCKGAL